MRRSALFLDRDGVINVDRGYVHRPDQFEFVPGIFELARFTVHELRRPIVVIPPSCPTSIAVRRYTGLSWKATGPSCFHQSRNFGCHDSSARWSRRW